MERLQTQPIIVKVSPIWKPADVYFWNHYRDYHLPSFRAYDNGVLNVVKLPPPLLFPLSLSSPCITSPDEGAGYRLCSQFKHIYVSFLISRDHVTYPYISPGYLMYPLHGSVAESRPEYPAPHRRRHLGKERRVTGELSGRGSATGGL